jgi:RNA polymerase subunit RPABC4/transcription elongation factor Spt4
MMHCQNCGQVNTQSGNFCRFCGTKFTTMQYSNNNNYDPQPNPAPANYENAPPRPYSWKTDEYQLPEDKTPKAKTINRVQPLSNVPPPLPSFQNGQNAAMQTFQQSAMANQNFHCPRCHSNLFPRVTRQISTAGWIVFAVLLLAFFPLFWIGFLIKEDVRTCPVCNYKYQ